MLSYEYAYLFLGVILIPLWLLFYLIRKDLRNQMLIVSLCIGVIGPIAELWFIQDYWRPETILGYPIGIEDVVYPFLLGGISSVIYKVIFKKRHYKEPIKKHNWRIIFLILFVIAFILLNILYFLLGVNSIYASMIAYIFMASAIFFYRKDLILSGLFSGLLLSAAFMMKYQILLPIYPNLFEQLWMLENVSGTFILKVPAEELLWAFTWGLLAGPIYEFYCGLRYAK